MGLIPKGRNKVRVPKGVPLALGDLGALRDDPLALLNEAALLVEAAKRMERRMARTPEEEERERIRAAHNLDMRMAAELAHLAISAAVEQTAPGKVTGYSEELERVEKLAGEGDPERHAETHTRLRATLHGSCFHQNDCDALHVEAGAAGELPMLLAWHHVRWLLTKVPKAGRRR